mmetsp:Transcript_15300/g.42386  ORF Transcript_15300/g.42386 Transcript_15300/m.42386 type:complete len:219 (+) Transcript_15300:248-904(+)
MIDNSNNKRVIMVVTGIFPWAGYFDATSCTNDRGKNGPASPKYASCKWRSDVMRFKRFYKFLHNNDKSLTTKKHRKVRLSTWIRRDPKTKRLHKTRQQLLLALRKRTTLPPPQLLWWQPTTNIVQVTTTTMMMTTTTTKIGVPFALLVTPRSDQSLIPPNAFITFIKIASWAGWNSNPIAIVPAAGSNSCPKNKFGAWSSDSGENSSEAIAAAVGVTN